MTLWIFGHSMCLPFDMPSDTLGWPHLLSKKLGIKYNNLAQNASDNFFIYSCYNYHKDKIQSDDIVIIGWSHPSRKTFVLDRTNPVHVENIDKGLMYQVGDIELIRSLNPVQDTMTKWLNMIPRNRGNKFYDTWFTNYYSEFEQSTNFKAYLDSVQLTCPGIYVPFYFNRESVKDLDVCGAGYYLDFALENQVYISEQNVHLNESGHRQWAEVLLKYINDLDF
jgi:hypothetical protein